MLSDHNSTTSHNVPYPGGVRQASDDQALLRRAVKAEHEVIELRTVVHQQQGLLSSYRRREAEQRNILASEGLTAGEKVSLLGLRDHWQKDDLPTDSEGRKRTCLKTLSYHLGQSDEAIGRHVKKFADLGLVDKHTVKGVAPDGMPTTTLYTAPVPEKIQAIRTLTKEAAGKSWGGLRCPRCSSTHVRITRTIVCLDCQNIAVDEKIYDSQGEHPTVTGLVLMPKPQDAATENQPMPSTVEDDLSPTKPHLAALFKQEYPLVPHLAATGQLSDDETLERGGNFLLAIAGPAQTYVKMLPADPDHKYTTVHQPIEAIITRLHLRGYETVGTTLEYPNGQALAICADADDGVHSAILRAAGGKLADAGWLPLWEASPAQDDHQGGGHLWVIFDALTDARSAWVEALRIAPELNAIKERWPSKKRVRLLAGKFVRPGINEWCTLTSIAGGESVKTGLDAIRLALANRTPAALVPILPPEPEKPAPSPVTVLAPVQGERVGWINGLHPQHIARYFAAQPGHTLEEIHPKTTATHAMAIWRGENGASVLYNDNGRWFDFGNHGDYPQSGDELDLYVLVHLRPSAADFKTVRNRVFIEIGRQMARGA